jgi:CRISPR system Cascade subunit CasB
METYDLIKYMKGKIHELSEDDSAAKAACARLRRAVGKPLAAAPDVWDVVLWDIPEEWRSGGTGEASYPEKAVYTAIALYAAHIQGKEQSMHADGVSFGTAVGELVLPDESNLDAVKRRFNSAVTSTDLTELAWHARGLIQLIKGADIKFDYPRFAKDLFNFQLSADNANRVRLRWGEDFYGTISKNNKREDV